MAASSHSPYPRSPNPPPTARPYDASSASSSATSPKRSHPQAFGSLLSSAGVRSNPVPTPQPIGIPPLPPIHHHQPRQSTSNYQPYTPVTASSSMGRDSLPSNDAAATTPGPSSAQLPGGGGGGGGVQSSSSSSQKRPYRQRRKDPSCDACRERKVKCDATETSSCSECSSRNVKCQFTKETNRRMSSIKQVQDLEKQMDRLRRENGSLKRMLQERDGRSEMEVDSLEQLPVQLPPLRSQPKRKRRPTPTPTATHDSARARPNLRAFSRGIWKAPAQYRQDLPRTNRELPKLELPPRPTTDELLKTYYTSVHNPTPILHWPTFEQAVEDLYRAGGIHRASPSFLSLFFAVLAAATLFHPESHLHRSYKAAELLETVQKLIDPWSNDFQLDDVRTLLLVAVTLNEFNLKSAAWNWLGKAVKAGQEIGLHLESETWPIIEAEMRRRTWWSIYILDRILALELGLPASIDDTDCDVALPALIDDYFIHDGGIMVPNGADSMNHSLFALVNVARSYTALNKVLAAPVITPARLAMFDQYFGGCHQDYSRHCDHSSTINISPDLLNPFAFLLHSRLVLHRHNLAPTCSADARVAAVEQCRQVALETASLIARSTSLAEGASALLTTHVFRCALFLLLVGQLDAATTLVGALAKIHNRRDVAVPCGRFLVFFAMTLVSRRAEYATGLHRRSGSSGLSTGNRLPTPEQIQDALVRDEELLTYVSTDVQAGADRQWVWAGSEHEMRGSQQQQQVSSAAAMPRGYSGSKTGPRDPSIDASNLLSMEARTGLTEEEGRDWGGWERVDNLLRELATAPMIQQSLSTAPGAGAIKAEMGSLLPPMSVLRANSMERSISNSPTGVMKSANQERISIANII